MNADLIKTLYVEAAHANPKGGEAQRRLHGHSYRIELLAGGPVDDRYGWLVDYADLKALFQPLYDQLDHGHLNAIPGLRDDPSMDGLRQWIEASLRPWPDWFRGVRVAIRGDLAYRPVALPEDPAHRFGARIRFTFEAAQSLPGLPEGHPCRKVHGHSYAIEVGAPDLDALAPHLHALYDTLDHRYLNDIAGLEHATCEYIARWTWAWLEARGAAPRLITVQETPSAWCIYFGERA
jgi:6-pyruvoyltetrahydropterin/6-carboxytetrahydropterin synthase